MGKYKKLKFILALSAVLGGTLFFFKSPASTREHLITENHFKLVRTPFEERLKQKGLNENPAAYIRIFKEEAVLEVWLQKPDDSFILFNTYPICYFSGALGPKLKQGDRQSPEGFYSITLQSLNPYSSYHLSFNLGYPNAYDRYHGYTGDYLMVHGNCVSIGCYAMTNIQIEEIYSIVKNALNNGQQKIEVHIFPFRFTNNNMAKHKNNKWVTFWERLKPAYDFFETNNRPPEIRIANGQYVIKE